MAATPRGLLGLVAMAAVAALFLSFGAFQIYSHDAPLHLVTGRLLIQDPSSAGENRFSFTNPDHAWFNDKWLENVLVYLVDAAGGPAALVVLRMGLLLALGLFLWKAMGTASASPTLRLAILSLVPWVAYERFHLRPELFSLVFIAVLIWLLARDAPTPKSWIFVAVLHAVWVNLHGYWIVGPLILLAFLTGDAVESWTGKRGWPPGCDPAMARVRLRHRATLLLAALGGALISPYPFRLFLNPFRVLGFLGGQDSPMGAITELQSPFSSSAMFKWALPFFVAAALAALICLLLNALRARPSHWFLFLGFFLMAAGSRRNIGMFAVVGAIVACWSLASWLAARREGNIPEPAPGRWARLLPVVLVLANIAAGWFVLTDRFYLFDSTSRRTGLGMSRLAYPVGMADFLVETRPPLRFFNDFVSGNYLAYRLFPQYRIYIAGNTFKYPLEFLVQYSLLTQGGDTYKEVTEQYDLNAFAIRYISPDMMPLARRLLDDPVWEVVYFDESALLFVRRLPELGSFIEQHKVDFGDLARERAGRPAAEARRAGLGGLLRPVPYPLDLSRGMFLQKVGQPDLAEVEYRRALQVDPGRRDARHALGEVLLEMGRFQEAADIFVDLLDDAPGPWDWIRVGFDRLRGAPQATDEPHLWRDVFRAWSGTGSKHGAAGEWTAARKDLEAAVDALERARRMDRAGDPMRNREIGTRFNLGMTLLRLSRQPGGEPGLSARADAYLSAAQRLQPDDPAMNYRLARARAVQGRSDEALDLLERAITVGGRDYVEAALRDDDLDTLRDTPRFRRIVQVTIPSG